MAIELGLHSSSNNPVLCGARETETRQRVFWTAYILEITLAYNLGRPPPSEKSTSPLRYQTSRRLA